MTLNQRPGRYRHILLSLGLHLALGALVVVLSRIAPVAEEKVYQVALVQLPGPPAPLAPPSPKPAVAPKPPALEPEPAPPPPAAPPEPEPVKQISPLKKPAAAPKPAPQPAPAPRPEPAPEDRAAGPAPSHNVGGLAAYDAALVDEPPAVTRRVLPVYPARARGRVPGRVEISLVVDVEGKPREIRVLKAEPPGYGFEEAALEAAGKTRFMPGKVRGKPVNTLVTLPFVFNIR